MKAHIGVDAESGLVHSVIGKAAANYKALTAQANGADEKLALAQKLATAGWRAGRTGTGYLLCRRG